ncbi:MAG: ribosomal protein S7e-domain-containing protein, partial [Olpidium bornovanus]
MSARSKIANPAGQPIDEVETTVAQAIFDLEQNVPELRADLRPLHLTTAKEIELGGGKKAIVIFVPVPQLKQFHKVQIRCGATSAASKSGDPFLARVEMLVTARDFRYPRGKANGSALISYFLLLPARLTRELEKKFSDRHVLLIAQRRIMRKPTRRSRVKQQRPRSRTLTAVHDAVLEDLVYPTE